MKLWLLRPIGNKEAWKPWYDKVYEFVIRAETEESARKIADDRGGRENHDGVTPWLDPEQTSCADLTKGSTQEVISCDYVAA